MSDDNVIQMNGHAEPDLPPGTIKEDPPLSIGARCLYQAALLIDGERAVAHGDRHANFKNIAELWTAYLGQKITPHDAALMMALLKIARTKTNPNNRDNYVDGAGYTGLASELVE